MKKPITIFITGFIKKSVFIVLLFFSTLLYSQEWEWSWVNTVTEGGKDSWTETLTSDFFNNNYCRTPYDSAIYFPDTAFLHPGQFNYANYAISKYNRKGDFLDALDIYTITGSNIQFIELQTDSALNIFLCAPFQNKVFINDTVINAAQSPYPWQPDVFIAKLNHKYEVQWSRLITSEIQDDLRGFLMSDDGNIYIATIHYANGGAEKTIFLSQDTSSTYKFTMNSLTKINLNGDLMWNIEILSKKVGTDITNLTIGDNGLIYLQGSSYGNIFIGEDTLYHPYINENKLAKFIVAFDQNGNIIDGFFLDWGIGFLEFKVAENNNIYISRSISDTAIIGNDTIIVPQGEHYYILGKFSSQFTPLWYKIFETNSYFRILLDNENLLFMTNANGTFQIEDTTIYLGSYKETILGEFGPDGELINIKTTKSVMDLVSKSFLLDNCKNIVISGYYNGVAIFGNDTIYSNDYNIKDGFVAKLIRTEQQTIDIGPDTISCEEFTIQGPEGYTFYLWNDSLTNQNQFLVTTSGKYYLDCANEDGCWLNDTINITIHSKIEIDIGNDTTIKQNDTIVFTLPDEYESYLWYDGSISNSILITGSNLGLGTFPIWVFVTDGPCTVTDTLYLTVINEFGINENRGNYIEIVPNPASDIISIINNSGIKLKEVKIFNITGKIVLQRSKPISKINISSLIHGIYFLEIKTEKENLRKKLIVY